MAKPISFVALNSKTHEPTTDLRQLAASRCFAILFTCANTVDAVQQGKEEVIVAALGDLLLSLLTHTSGSGSRLTADTRTLAAMCGCRLHTVNGKVDA
jgi:hypothetical protein